MEKIVSSYNCVVNFCELVPINLVMLVPMLLGYLVGAVGVYTLLLRLSPVVVEDRMAHNMAPEADAHVEVIELFPQGLPEDQIKAA